MGVDQPTRLLRVAGMPMRAPTSEFAALFCACLLLPRNATDVVGIQHYTDAWDIVEIADTLLLENDRAPSAQVARPHPFRPGPAARRTRAHLTRKKETGHARTAR